VALVLVALLGVHFWAQAEYRAAVRALEDEHYSAGLEHIENYLSIWPSSTAAHLLAARLARLKRDYPQAEHYLKECARLQHGATEAIQLEWVLLRTQQGEIDELVPNLWACVEADHPETLAILETLARTYMYETRFRPSLFYLNEWLQRAPDTVRALDWRGWVRERLNQTQDALKDYQRVLELEPERSAVRLRLASLLLADNHPKAALPHLERLREHEPDRPEILVGLARCWFQMGRLDEARQLFDQVYAAHPEHVPALIQRGKLELQAQRFTEAEKWLRRALELSPHEMEAQIPLHKSVQLQPGREKEAEQLLKEAEAIRADVQRLGHLLTEELDKAPGNADIPSEIGTLLLKIGHDQLGLYWLHVALKRDENHQKTHAVLADYFEKHKEPAKAAKHRRHLQSSGTPERATFPAPLAVCLRRLPFSQPRRFPGVGDARHL
jgi:tetratricopeptide (TPR) repeat protein